MQEFLVAWLTISICWLFLYPLIRGRVLLKYFNFPQSLFSILIVIAISALIALVVASTQITKFNIKNLDLPIMNNMKGVFILSILISIFSYLLLTEQLNYWGSDLKQSPVEFFGRGYRFHRNYQTGTNLLVTIISGALLYPIIWIAYLKILLNRK